MDDITRQKLMTKQGQKKLQKIIDVVLASRTREYKIGKKEDAKERFAVAVEWIALNDDVGLSAKDAEGCLIIALIADIFEKSRKTVAREVIAFKKRQKNEQT